MDTVKSIPFGNKTSSILIFDVTNNEDKLYNDLAIIARRSKKSIIAACLKKDNFIKVKLNIDNITKYFKLDPNVFSNTLITLYDSNNKINNDSVDVHSIESLFVATNYATFSYFIDTSDIRTFVPCKDYIKMFDYNTDLMSKDYTKITI